jgi:YggT family protein
MAPKGRKIAQKRAISRLSSVGAIYGGGSWGVKAVSLVPAAVARYMSRQPTGFSMRAILDVILLALQLYVWLLIAAAVLSWLIAFNVVNTRNQFVATVGEFLYRITEPALRPIRNMMPNLGGIDISPVILILLIFLIERIILYYIYPNVL